MFWEKFVELCARRGVSPSAVCARLGFGSSTATHWKKGSMPGATSLYKIAEFFSVPVGYFSDRSEMPEGPAPVSGGVRVPVYGKVAAGIPIEAITDIEDYEEISEEMARGGEYFALRISGDSMEPKISNGDTVIVRRQPDCENGEIAIVLIDREDATCKRIKKMSSGIMLISDNPKYNPMVYTAREVQTLPVCILGKVVELRARL